MGNFRVLCGREVIGTSALEDRDPAMGIARGRFMPCPAYERVRPVFRMFVEAQRATGPADENLMAAYYRSRDGLGLAVETDSGKPIPATTVHIEDMMDEGDETACEVEVHVSDASFFISGPS
jgi:hypothetical protein